MIELDRPARRLRQRDGFGGRSDFRPLVQQFGQPLGRARGAQQIAINFAQRPERAADQHRGRQKRGERPRRQPPRRDIGDGAPQQQGDRAEDQRDEQGREQRAQQDAALGGGEAARHRIGKALRLAAFLPERLDDLHRRKHLDRHCANVGDAVLAGARMRPQPPPEQNDRQQRERNTDQDHPRQLRRKHEQRNNPANPGNGIAQRDRYGGADRHFDLAGIGGKARSDFGRAVLLEPARRQVKQIVLHRDAHVGDGAFAQPRHEIESDRGGDAQHQHDREQQIESAVDMRHIAAVRKTAVDHRFERPRNIDCRGRSDEQRTQRDRQLHRISAGIAPHHGQTAELALGRFAGERALGVCHGPSA
ncbi:hypothetical protein D9M73_113390 [compost metagenome]